MVLLEALEAWPVAAWLRVSFYAYPLLNALHILAIGMLVTSALLMDARVLGAARSIPAATVIGHIRPVAIGALAVALATGFLLFSVRPVDYAFNPAFQVKMLVLAAAILNAALFTSFRLHRDGAAVSGRILALLSILLWLGVLLAGRMIGFVE